MDDTIVTYFNYAEAALWAVIACVLLVKRRGSEVPIARLQLLAAVAFFFFGISDLVETQTGAWWKPWWLLVWKVACVVALLGTLIVYKRHSPAEK